MMLDAPYGAVLHPDWSQQVVRDHHPIDGSRVYTVGVPLGSIERPARSRVGSVLLLHGVGNSGARVGVGVGTGTTIYDPKKPADASSGH